MRRACQDEVIELHHFFQQWFAGELADTPEAFARFADVIGTDFEIISPGGVRKGRAPLLEDLRGAHGVDPEAKIWIRNFEWREVGSGLYQVTYEEWQRSGDDDKGRLSSALFHARPGLPHGVEWLHLHEVWLPDRGK
jgi:hypothetical protein